MTKFFRLTVVLLGMVVAGVPFTYAQDNSDATANAVSDSQENAAVPQASETALPAVAEKTVPSVPTPSPSVTPAQPAQVAPPAPVSKPPVPPVPPSTAMHSSFRKINAPVHGMDDITQKITKAETDLQKLNTDLGGHRTAAVAYLKQALQELQEGQ